MSATDKVSTCRVCYNSASEYPSTSDSCDHEHSICRACVMKHIRSEIFKGNVVNIVCPSANCEVVLGYCDIKKLIPRDLFERYGLFLLRHVIRQLEDFRWCKRQGCGWGQEHSSGDEAPIMTCHACKFKTCYTCDVPWHEGITCEEFKQRMEDDPHGAANNAYHDRHTKQCPKCKWPIEKKSGCEHMTCICGYEFCWLCLSDYDQIRKEGNHRHKSTCQHYAPLEEDDDEEDDLYVY